MNVIEEVKKLSLPENNYVVVGSGILAALNIRDSNDVDLIVSDHLFETLQKQGWEEGEWTDQKVLKKGIYDVGTLWSGKTFGELINDSTVIDDIPFLSLADLRTWKQEHARQKDLHDIELIDKYLAEQN